MPSLKLLCTGVGVDRYLMTEIVKDYATSAAYVDRLTAK